MSKEAVVLMAKAPVPGLVKTRLCPPLSPEEAARLYARMLGDAAEEISSVVRIARYLFLDPPEASNVLREAPFSSFDRFPQRGKDLGEKMLDAAETAFRLGATRVVIVGGDCPALTAERLRRGFRELAQGAEAVFGPSADGGYYLVGLACPHRLLFRNLAWSTPTVLPQTVARCRTLSIPFSFLPTERDVDTGEDLFALKEWSGTRALPACPRTREWITGFFGPGVGGSPVSRERTPGPRPGSRSRRGG